MSQEASKFSVASMCHFILGTTCGISARAGRGGPAFISCQWEDTSSEKIFWLKKYYTVLVKTVRCPKLSHTENCCVKVQMK